MKCPNCGGKGKYKNGFGKVGVCYYCLGTGKVNNKGEQVRTNEEWFCTLSTEEKADKLTDFSFWLVFAIPTEDKREKVRKRIVEWLKQLHTNE